MPIPVFLFAKTSSRVLLPAPLGPIRAVSTPGALKPETWYIYVVYFQ